MAKRMTATDKWEDGWFFNLSPGHKLLWTYLLDKCDCAGVMEFNPKLIRMFTGVRITEEEFFRVFGEKVLKVNQDKIWLKDFIEFQYGIPIDELTDGSAVHRGVLKIIEKYGLRNLSVSLTEALPNPSERVKDKEKDKEKEKAKDKSIENGDFGENVRLTAEEFANLCERLKSERRARRCIEILDNYKGATGKKYKSDYRAILNWVIARLEDEEAKAHKGPVLHDPGPRMLRCEKCHKEYEKKLILCPKCYPKEPTAPPPDVARMLNGLAGKMVMP